ncbi:hypothetical protein Pdw03_1473 [Penicillium digitatum]|uniref:Uncharacterized protein n=1 Tax=Penicillium digitatum TaxID=36651 RepID=A0A7T6XSF6_PENDI|nr:hypothetical protein Pdw03_1473 [Penicillium digitatum]
MMCEVAYRWPPFPNFIADLGTATIQPYLSTPPRQHYTLLYLTPIGLVASRSASLSNQYQPISYAVVASHPFSDRAREVQRFPPTFNLVGLSPVLLRSRSRYACAAPEDSQATPCNRQPFS